jgi:hypothetical protein
MWEGEVLTDMYNAGIVLVMGFLLIVVFSLGMPTDCGFVNVLADDKEIFDRIVLIRGKVTELNNLDLGETQAHGSTPIIFKKHGCKNCIFATRPDSQGNYEVQLGKGKYELIVMAPSPPQHDLLAPSQQREVNATGSNSSITLDIKLKLPQ